MDQFMTLRNISGEWVVINIYQISVITFNKMLNCFEVKFSGGGLDRQDFLMVQLYRDEASKIFKAIGVDVY